MYENECQWQRYALFSGFTFLWLTFSLRERKFCLESLAVEGDNGIEGIALFALEALDDSRPAIGQQSLQLVVG